LSGVWRLTATIPTVGLIPWPIALPAAAADLVGALAYRSAPVPANPGAPLTAAFLSAITYGAAATRRARAYENAEGEQVFPGVGALHGFGVVGARYWDDLDGTQRRPVVVGGAVLAAVAFFGAPRRHLDWAALAMEVPFALVPCFAPVGFDRRKKAKIDMLLNELQGTIDREIDIARKLGRTSEIRVTRSYVDQADAALAELEDELDPADVATIRQMCDEARAWLDAAAT
jgi:hypothetical protein